MSFFTFDNIHSSTFNLRIAYINAPSVRHVNTYANPEIISDRSGRRDEPYIFGRRLPDTLEFPSEIYNADGRTYDNHEIQAIQEWLFGRQHPKYLSLIENDSIGESYLCYLTNPSSVKVGNRVIVWRFTVTSVAPWGFTDVVEQTFDCSTQSLTYIDVHNLSTTPDVYLMPEMTVQLVGNTSYVSIYNLTDDEHRAFQITNLQQGDTIRVDNDKQIMSADIGDQTGNNAFRNFNMNWFRLKTGINRLRINGRCVVTFKMRFRKAVGGI